MNTTAILARLDELQGELNTLEAQMTSNTLPHSDQALLDVAWDLIVNEMEALQDILAIQEANQLVDPREEESQDPYADYAYGESYDPTDEI